jgi:hypothetical protein
MMMQEAIVAVIVAYAVWVVAKRYAPKPVRLALANLATRAALWLGWNRLAAKFEPKPQVSSACGSCGGCGSASSKTSGQRFTMTPEALKRTIIR